VNPVLALAVVAVAGLAVTRLPRLPAPSALHLDLARSAGLPLVLLGVLLGPALRILDGDVLRALAPVTALGVGWVGALVGSSLRWRYLRRIPRPLWLLALFEAAAVLLLTTVVGWLLARLIPALGSAWRPALPTALALAAIAVVTGPAAVAMTARAVGVRRAVARAFELAAWLDTAFGALAFTLALALYHPREPAGGLALGWIAWLALALASGALFGILFLGLTRRQRSAEDVGLSLLGVLLFGAGVGYAADLSPFLICGVSGAFIAHRSPHRRRALALLSAWEYPLTAVFFILAGAMLTWPTWWLAVAPLFLAVTRIAARWGAVRYGRALLHLEQPPPHLGLAGVAQGTVVVALGMNFEILYGSTLGGAVMTTVLLGLGIATLAAPWCMTRALAPLTAPPPSPEVTG
jgi:hypothetical protein